MPTLNDEIKSLLTSQGADLIGFADLQEISPDAHENFTSGVSIAVALNPYIIMEVKEGPTKSYIDECHRADKIIDSLGKLTVAILVSNGYKAKQQAITNTTGTKYPTNLATKLPHKTIATRAGLGWIGKCALLVTKEFGSAVRLGSIITDGSLSFGIPIDISNCGDCNACVNLCPVKTISGEEWYAGIKREALFDAFTCRNTARELLSRRTGGEIIGRTFCGICIATCPWTQTYLEKARR